MSVLGLSVLGLSVLGLSVLGLSVLGLSVLGLSVLGLDLLFVYSIRPLPKSFIALIISSAEDLGLSKTFCAFVIILLYLSRASLLISVFNWSSCAIILAASSGTKSCALRISVAEGLLSSLLGCSPGEVLVSTTRLATADSNSFLRSLRLSSRLRVSFAFSIKLLALLIAVVTFSFESFVYFPDFIFSSAVLTVASKSVIL